MCPILWPYATTYMLSVLPYRSVVVFFFSLLFPVRYHVCGTNFSSIDNLCFLLESCVALFSPTLSRLLNNLYLTFVRYFTTVVFYEIINDIVVVYARSAAIRSWFASCSIVSPIHDRRTCSSCSASFDIICTCRPSCCTLHDNSARASLPPLLIFSLTCTFVVFSAL